MNKLIGLLSISLSFAATDHVLRSPRNLKKAREAYTITGSCSTDDFLKAVSKRKLLKIFGLNSTDEMQGLLDQKCGPAVDFGSKDFSDSTGKGPQFLKNFFDGGTTWNDNYETEDGDYKLSQDAKVILEEYEETASSKFYTTPDGGTEAVYEQYFSNFYSNGEECLLGAIECCYTGNRMKDVQFEGNSQMCALDMVPAKKSNHIQSHAFTVYDGNDPNDIYCSAFAYEKDSFGEKARYNTLFHMAMKTNLYDKGLVKNVPGAPLCGCVEQMPTVDYADCFEAVEGYILDDDGNVKLNISWKTCESDFRTHYNSLTGKSRMEKYFVNEKIVEKGKCEEATTSFLNDLYLIPDNSAQGEDIEEEIPDEDADLPDQSKLPQNPEDILEEY